MTPSRPIAFGGNAYTRTLGLVVLAATPLVLIGVALLAWKVFGPSGAYRRYRQRKALDHMLRGVR